jgi:hypothetical protein
MKRQLPMQATMISHGVETGRARGEQGCKYQTGLFIRHDLDFLLGLDLILGLGGC